MTYPKRPVYPSLALAGLLVPTSLATLGCGHGDGPVEEHGEIERVELETRGASPGVVAVWSAEDGWRDADGEPIDELPPAVDDGGELAPLRAGGPHASLAVRFYDHGGDAVEMATLSQDDATGERECTEDSVRYFPLDDDTDIIAWPPVAHPDNPDGSFQFVERSGGELIGIFHCDHVDIYPEVEGTVEVEFVLWHDDHGDDATDALTVRVAPAE